MGKTDFSQLQGLKYPSSLLAIPNREELHFIEGWDLIKDEVKRLTNLAWDADGKGYKIKANNYYQAVNIYYYMIHLNLTINKELQRKKLSSITQEISDKYNLECIRKNLTCLGVKYETSLLKVWDEVFTVEGEFSPCEFPIEEVTQAFNANYDACIEEVIKTTVSLPITIENDITYINVEANIPTSSDLPLPIEPNTDVDYGFLYNWYTIETGVLAPIGWRVTSHADWETLEAYVTNAGNLKTTGTIEDNTGVWKIPNTGATNVFNLSIIPSGYRYSMPWITKSYDPYGAMGLSSDFWKSDESFRDSTNKARYRSIDYNIDYYLGLDADKKYGFSIRCVRDLTVSENLLSDGTYLDDVIDIDGNIYKVVKIGTQAWMTSNLKTTRYNNGEIIPKIIENSVWDNLTTGAYCSFNNE